MTLYSILLFLHIATAIVWLGAGVTLQVLATRADRSRDSSQMLKVASDNEYLAMRLFIPASLAVFLLGVGLVLEGPWSFGQLWITIGLIGYAASFFVGLLFIKPQGARIEALLAEHGGGHPEVARRVRSILLVARIELAVLFVVVLDMSVKPTGESAGFFVVSAVGLALVAALAYRSYAAAARFEAAPATSTR